MIQTTKEMRKEVSAETLKAIVKILSEGSPKFAKGRKGLSFEKILSRLKADNEISYGDFKSVCSRMGIGNTFGAKFSEVKPLFIKRAKEIIG